MNVDDLIKVGTIRKSFGLKGTVKVAFETFFLDYTDNLETFFLDEGGSKVPYFVENLELRFDGGGVIKLEDIDTKEQAQTLNGKEIFVIHTQYEGLQEAALDEDYYGDLKGLDAILVHADNLNLGKITSIQYFTEHECAILKYKGKEIMLPLHDDVLIEFDDEKAYFNLDETYLSIYFEKDKPEDRDDD